MAEACAIARRAVSGELEEVKIHQKPTDVLANQIVGLGLDFGDISMDRAYEIIVRALYPFRDLTREEFQAVADQISEHRLVRVQDGILQRTRKAREYYFENLSMIPDEKRFKHLRYSGQEVRGHPG